MTDSRAQSAQMLMSDPISFFDRSITKMHMIERSELEALQKIAVQKRFREHYESIEMLRTLADQIGVGVVRDLDDLVPLLLPHTIFKSYASSVLDRKRFDIMTKWLGRLTSYDISDADVSDCETIDAWIDALDRQTPLHVSMSSGTTGAVSLIPRSRKRAVYNMELWKLFLFQTFGREPTEGELNPVVDVIWPNYAAGKLGHLRWAEIIKTAYTGSDESRFHPLYEDAIDVDLMYLSSKLRAAASQGKLAELKIDPKLLGRKKDFEAMQARKPQELTRFFEKCTSELRGKRVFMVASYSIMYDVAVAGLQRGVRAVFAPNSAILTGGGAKNVALPANFMETIKEFLGVDRIQEGYGMSEIGAYHWACDEGHYHVQPWTIPFVLDPDTGEAMPRKGLQTGRAAFYDILNESYWGGVISGDEITLDWEPCACGLKSSHIRHNIVRYSEKRGVEDDRVTCAVAEDMHNEVLSFLQELE